MSFSINSSLSSAGMGMAQGSGVAELARIANHARGHHASMGFATPSGPLAWDGQRIYSPGGGFSVWTTPRWDATPGVLPGTGTQSGPPREASREGSGVDPDVLKVILLSCMAQMADQHARNEETAQEDAKETALSNDDEPEPELKVAFNPSLTLRAEADRLIQIINGRT